MTKSALASFLFLLSFSAMGFEVPKLLSQTGLYSSIEEKRIAVGNRLYEPQYPLWSDGAEKKRWIFLPPQTQINTGRASGPTSPAKGNIDYWIFPVGTRLWKEFSFTSLQTAKSKRVETRWMEKTSASTWTFATYLWNDTETEAQLAPETGIQNYFPIGNGISHDILSTHDCLSCHKPGGDPVLGFGALQLSADRDALAPHTKSSSNDSINLTTLASEGLISHLPKAFENTPPKIYANTPQSRAAIGYLAANCGNCHNPTGPAGFTYLLMHYPAETTDENLIPVITSAVEKPCYQFKIPGQTRCLKIKPGDPELSALFLRMNTATAPVHMPPLGSKVVDIEAVRLIKNWIEGMDVPGQEKTEHR